MKEYDQSEEGPEDVPYLDLIPSFCWRRQRLVRRTLIIGSTPTRRGIPYNFIVILSYRTGEIMVTTSTDAVESSGYPGGPDLRGLVTETGERWLAYRKTLTPRYGQVWFDILLCYAMLAVGCLAICWLSLHVSLIYSLPAALVAALWLGFWFESLSCFVHEATHGNLCRLRWLNDLLSNWVVLPWFPIDVVVYRRSHWQHHLYLGGDRDTEISYHNQPSFRFLMRVFSGLYFLQVIFRYGRTERNVDSQSGDRFGQWRFRIAILRATILNLLLIAAAFMLAGTAAAVCWALAVLAYLAFGILRQILEHRADDAVPGEEYDTHTHPPTNRLFGTDFLSRTFGNAGFNRHLLHHWDPAISYTRFSDMEAFLLRTSARSAIEVARNSYWQVFRAFLSKKAARQLNPVAPGESEAPMPCPVCGTEGATFYAAARDLEYFTSERTYLYYTCRACSCVFLNHPPVDRLAEIYPPDYYSFSTHERPSFIERIKRWLDARLFRKVLAELPGGAISVLDVGGGSGWLLSVVRSVSPRVTTSHEVDLEEQARAPAEAAGHVFHRIRIEEFTSDLRFHLILMLNLVEHVADPAMVLTKAASLLAPGGRLIVKTPNTDTLDCRLFRHRNWGGFHCPRLGSCSLWTG